MQRNFTTKEIAEMDRLLLTMKDTNKQAGQRRIAMARFDYIFNKKRVR